MGAGERAQRGGMMRDLRQGKVAGVNLEQLEGPEGKVAWMEMWLRAFGFGDEKGESKLEEGGASYEHQVSRFEVLAFAEMVWERIEMFRQHGEKEAAEVKEALQDSVLARRAAASSIDDCELPVDDCAESGTPESQLQTESEGRVSNFEFRVSSAEPSTVDAEGQDQPSIAWSVRDLGVMLLAPLAVIKCMRAQLDAYKDLNRGYYELLVRLYGPRAEFESFLRESKQSAMDQAAAIILGLLGGHIRAKGGSVEGEIEWRGGPKGRRPGGGP